MSPARVVAVIAWALLLWAGPAHAVGAEKVGSRFAYLDGRDPYYPHLKFPKLTAPMWVGQEGVEAVILLTVDDMGRPDAGGNDTSAQEFERFLTPLIDRLKQIDGRAPITIFTCQTHPADPCLQRLLQAGLSLDCHSYTHPVPLMRIDGQPEPGDESLRLPRYDFVACLENLLAVPGNRPVAYRMPGCDARNTSSPRFYTEVFPAVLPGKGFLAVDSSVMNCFVSEDPALEPEWRRDADGKQRFEKYVSNIPQTRHFVNYISSYPYPYVIDGRIWEFPATIPCDSHGVHKYRHKSPRTVEDWKRAVDVTVRKQGLCTLLFHTIGYIENQQLVEVIDYADRTYGRRVKFLNCREVYQRLTDNLLGGTPLRNGSGADNGVRLLDVNADGYLDAVVGNSRQQQTRLWHPGQGKWTTTSFPVALVTGENTSQAAFAGARFFTATADGKAGVAIATPHSRGVWSFDGRQWVAAKTSLPQQIDGQPLYTAQGGVDRGVRFRDVDGDGLSDLVVNNDSQNAVFFWQPDEQRWRPASFALPEKGCLVDAAGSDQGLRFVDFDGDGHEDLVLSNEREYWICLFENTFTGWSKKILQGAAGDAGSLPPIVHRGAVNGVWFHSGTMVLGNEFTATNQDQTVQHPFEQLLQGKALK